MFNFCQRRQHEESKKNSLEKLLFGLGIRHIGAKKAKVLAKYYKNLDALASASYEELSNLPDIGDVIAQSIVDYFANKDIYNLQSTGSICTHSLCFKNK